MSINQKSGRQTFRRRFVSGSLFVSPCPLECHFQSETKIEPDLRLTLCHFSLESGMVFESTTGLYERVYRFNSKCVRKKEKYANSKLI